MEVGVPIGTPVVRNVDGSMAQDNAYRLMDGYLDQEENLNSRPGLLLGARLNTSAQIDGIYWWDDIERIILVSGGHVWVMNSSFSGTDLGSATNLMASGTRAIFATDGTRVYIANGGRIIQSDGNTTVNTIYIADADAPTAVTHIVNIDGYLLANSVGTQRIYFSELEDPTTWSALDFFSAGGVPDDVVAIHEFRKEIYIFGKLSFEIWENDGETPFSRIGGGYHNTGCIAPYSIVNTDDGVMWLDNKKRIVRFSGGSIEHVATPYDKDIERFQVVSDCQADRLDILGREFYLFAFPSEQRTLVYNLTDNNWSEFGFWNVAGGFWERFIGNCYAYSPAWNQYIWGTRKNDGAIYKMSPNYFDDDGNIIRMQSLSGHISYGTNKRKRNNTFSMRAKRGRITDTSEPSLILRVNDDDAGWSNEISLSLGKLGNTYNTIRKHRLGVYHTRQYEFTATNACGISFGKAKEDIYVEQK